MASFEGDAGPVLGIDLGTTFSCVAVYDDAEKKVKVLVFEFSFEYLQVYIVS